MANKERNNPQGAKYFKTHKHVLLYHTVHTAIFLFGKAAVSSTSLTTVLSGAEERVAEEWPGWNFQIF